MELLLQTKPALRTASREPELSITPPRRPLCIEPTPPPYRRPAEEENLLFTDVVIIDFLTGRPAEEETC